MFYIRLFGVIFILIATFFNGIVLNLLTTDNDAAHNILLCLGIIGAVIAIIVAYILLHEASKAPTFPRGKGSVLRMQAKAFWDSDEGKKWSKRIETAVILGLLWFFSSIAMSLITTKLAYKIECAFG